MSQLDSTPADIRMIALSEADRGGERNEVAGLGDGNPVHDNLPCENQPEGTLTGRGKPPIDHEAIQPSPPTR
jgi:hypothetical protein